MLLQSNQSRTTERVRLFYLRVHYGRVVNAAFTRLASHTLSLPTKLFGMNSSVSPKSTVAVSKSGTKF